MLLIAIIVNLSKHLGIANVSALLVILSFKSLIYIKNNKGPNTDHCGTPLKTDYAIPETMGF